MPTRNRFYLDGHLGKFQDQVQNAVSDFLKQGGVKRIWDHDHTIWKPNPEGIADRLGWLHAPVNMKDAVGGINEFVFAVKRAGYTRAVLMGMGGSSLAPEVFRLIFGVKQGFLDLSVLDSVDPETIVRLEQDLDLSRTLFIVSTKSGGTVETVSLMRHFYNRICRETGRSTAGDHFAAITDPGSSLAATGKDLRFRQVFLNDPDIGGRYSALSYFGLVPAALIGVDITRILQSSRDTAIRKEHTAVALGVSMGVLALGGRDKLTFMISDRFKPFGAWIEQLIAESTGKQGRGILPVVDEKPAPPETYADDRFFVQIRLAQDQALDTTTASFSRTGHPVISIDVADPYDIGGEFFRWEMATAISGSILNINPFDQPDVESAKILTRKMVNTFQNNGALPQPMPVFVENGIEVYFENAGLNLKGGLEAFFSFLAPGDETGKGRGYVAIQAYLIQTPEIDAALATLRGRIQTHYRVATTVGYGPRFLHSTGQLHKGDAGNGLFIQLTTTPTTDLPIPDRPGADVSSITFGTLKAAQAMGDRQALLDAGRQVIRFHLTQQAPQAIHRLAASI